MSSLFLATKFKDKIPIGGKWLGEFDYEIKPEIGEQIRFNSVTYEVVGLTPAFGGNELVHIDIFLKHIDKISEIDQ